MFDVTNIQMYWPRPYIGGPHGGTMQNHSFVSVPHAGYMHTLWYAASGELLGEVNQHESIKTQADFDAAVSVWHVAEAK